MLNLSPVSTSKTRAVDSRNKGTLNPSCSRLFMKLTKIRRKKRKHRTNYHFTGHNYKPTFPRKQKKLQIEHFIDLQHCLPIFLLCKIAEGRTLCFYLSTSRHQLRGRYLLSQNCVCQANPRAKAALENAGVRLPFLVCVNCVSIFFFLHLLVFTWVCFRILRHAY